MTKLKADSHVAMGADEIALEIRRISNSMKALKDSKLNERAIVLLLQDITGLNKIQVKTMLSALQNLDTFFLKKEKKHDLN